jgi:hypothetical protein
LVKFERTHQVRLPEDYRLFLREIGNGGAGPYYGMEPLESAAQGCDLRHPFPLVKAQSYSSEGEIQDEIEVYNEREEYLGVLQFCEQGCAMYWYLVVNGPTYGMVWDGSGVEFAPTNLSFGLWYRGWAEKALRILENERLVNKLSIGMTQAQVLEVTGRTWKERKNQYSDKHYFEAPEIPAQIILSGENGLIKEIKPWLFISPRP